MDACPNEGRNPAGAGGVPASIGPRRDFGNTIGPVLAALVYAAEKHSGALRKNQGPYINHPIAVAELLANVGCVVETEVLQAAILHDVLEDTPTLPAEIAGRFGERVCSMVKEVTDDPKLPKAVRKALQIRTAPHLSREAKQIRIADKIANVSDITVEQPVNWTLERKGEYLDWAEQVVAGCRGGNASLEHHFDAILKERRSSLAKAG